MLVLDSKIKLIDNNLENVELCNISDKSIYSDPKIIELNKNIFIEPNKIDPCNNQ